jgi:dipeptidyl aminopeptidase/acylaminoacyl peptidase
MLAFAKVSDGSMNLWKVGAFSGSPTPLYAAPGYDSEPDWSPDGTKLALTSDANMFDFVTDIFVVGEDGSGFDGLTGDIPDGYDFVAPAWSPDGTKLSMMRHGSDGKEGYETTLVVMDADGANLAPLTAAAEYSRSSWSPDGERIAFNSTSNSVDWIDKDGGSTHVLIPNARNADWKPVPAPVSAPSAGPAAEFRAQTSPARGIVRFAVGAQAPGAVLAIHDVAGRRVDAVPLGADASMVTWDPGRCGCGAGVYFARLQPASSAARSVRFVMLR